MKMKILVLLSLLFGSSLGQSLSCDYRESIRDGVNHYACYLDIQNPSGFDGFTSINGTHLPGRTNADVTLLYAMPVSRTVIFPRITCSQFPNLVHIDFERKGIVTLSENNFAACRNVEIAWLTGNEIETIHENAFNNMTRLVFLDLSVNRLVNIPGNVFNSLVNLEELNLSLNQLFIPSVLFSRLVNLRVLNLMSTRLSAVVPEWFGNLTNLQTLTLYGNNITSFPEATFVNNRNLRSLEISRNPVGDHLPAGIFRELRNLTQLFMVGIRITQINTSWFATLENLEQLYIQENLFISIPEGSFDHLTNLLVLDIGKNHLPDSAIPANIFDNMPNLMILIADYNLIQTINPRWFQNIPDVSVLDFNFNQINDIPAGTFTSITSLREIDLWANNIKTISREAFGFIGNLTYADFEQNVINAIDERFLREASPLEFLFLFGNLCTGERFYSFGANRETFMPRLAVCTNNFRWITETTTSAGQPYRFSEAPSPGIQLRVNTNSEIRISLTSFDFIWNPVIEIVIGSNNNTLSTIIRNQDTQVVVAHSPNIIRPGQWTGLRITWSNHVVLVTREGQSYPFLAYNMECIYPVGFYGLRSIESDAIWSIQPVEAEIMPASA
ncbi:leucine-rich repeat-containing protein 15-like [Chironomus tepperi]|uniref:leucine-rich repeat-containing protein 15-like n=1 Tax=Chironomus tepperi TaxID=113505 RepID=UPI00391F2F0D